MTFSYDTPFSQYFMDDRFILHQYSQRESAILWVSYEIESGLNLSVYDDSAGRYTHTFGRYSKTQFPVTAQDIESFLAEVEDDYGTLIPRSLVERSEEFLSLSPKAFTVTADLSDSRDSEPCGNCGDYNDYAFEGSYFPGFNGIKDTVEVRFTYGCFGGDEQEASSDDTDRMNTVWQIIDDAIRGAENREGKKALVSFKQQLREATRL